MFQPLLISAGVVLCSPLCYAMTIAIIVGLVDRVLRGALGDPGFWKSVAVMMIVTLITVVAHLIEVALWALFYLLLCGDMATFETAFYFSAQNCAALGYGDVIPSQRWWLLGPLEAINGLLLFALSMAVMFAILSRLIINRFQHQHVRRSAGQESLSGNQDHESESLFQKGEIQVLPRTWCTEP
jgi:hypothetical protein